MNKPLKACLDFYLQFRCSLCTKNPWLLPLPESPAFRLRKIGAEFSVYRHRANSDDNNRFDHPKTDRRASPLIATSNHTVASRFRVTSSRRGNTEMHNPAAITASPSQSEWLRAHAKWRERIW